MSSSRSSEGRERLAGVVPGRGEPVEDQLGRQLGLVRVQHVRGALADDAALIGQGVLTERLRRSYEDVAGVGPLDELREQVLLQEGVGPVVATGAPRQDDLGVLQADDGVVGGQPQPDQERVQHVAPDVGAQGGHGVGRQAVGLGHDLHPAVPELGGGLRSHREDLVRHPVHTVVDLHVAGEGPGMQLLEREERVAAAASRGLLYRRVVEGERGADEGRGDLRFEGLHVDDDAVHRLAQLAELLGLRGAELHVFRPHRGHHHDALIGFFLVDPEQALEGRLPRVVQIVEEEEQRAAPSDAPERVTNHQSPRLEAVEGEANAAGPHRLIGGERPDPFGRARDPGAPVLVVRIDAPAQEQRLLDGVAVGALEVEIVRDAAEHAVERAAQATVARAQRDHRAFFVHDLAEPLDDAALADAGGSHQDDQAMGLPDALDHLVADLPQYVPHVVAPHQRARSDAEQARGALRCGRRQAFDSAPGRTGQARGRGRRARGLVRQRRKRVGVWIDV